MDRLEPMAVLVAAVEAGRFSAAGRKLGVPLAGSCWTFRGRARGPAQGASPRCRLNVNTAEAAIDAAVRGVGITHVLSYQVARPVAEGTRVTVPTDYETDPIPVHLVHAGRGLLPLKVRSLLDFAVPRLRKALAGAAGCG